MPAAVSAGGICAAPTEAKARCDGWRRNHSPPATSPAPNAHPNTQRTTGLNRPMSMAYLTRNAPPSATVAAPNQTIQRDVKRCSSDWVGGCTLGSGGVGGGGGGGAAASVSGGGGAAVFVSGGGGGGDVGAGSASSPNTVARSAANSVRKRATSSRVRVARKAATSVRNRATSSRIRVARTMAQMPSAGETRRKATATRTHGMKSSIGAFRCVRSSTC
jgi:hypothetical protein